MLLLEGNISNFTCARYYFFDVELSDFYVNQSLAGQTIQVDSRSPFIRNFLISPNHIMFNSLFTPRKQLQENTHGALARTKSGNKMHHLHRSLLQSLLNLFVETPQKSNSLQ
jgi:hypothetical protein